MDMITSKQTEEKCNDGVKFTMCPFCHGTGQLKENVEFPLIESKQNKQVTMSAGPKQTMPVNQCDTKLKSPNTVRLPLIKNKAPKTTAGDMNGDATQLVKHKKQHILKPQSAHASGDFVNEKGHNVQLLPPPTTLRNPVDAIKYAMLQLSNQNWEIVMQGLSSMVQVSRTNPILLEPHMTKINQTLCNLLRTMRSQVARYACQCTKEFFRTMQCTTRPEFDEIVQCLLQRTADMNKFIRHDANEALDSMVMYIPPINSVRAVVDKGPKHKNSLVRITVARLLLCTVTVIEVQNLFTLPAYKETRKRIFDTAALLMNDPNILTRNLTKQLFQMLIKDENFEALFYSEAEKKLVKKIDKALVCLKYIPQKNK